jgi:hypothetical protein
METQRVRGSRLPLYIRLPSPGAVDELFRLNRSCLDLICRPQEANDYKPPVRSKLLKQKGNRPIRLIEVRSLIEYLKSLPDGSLKENIVQSNANLGKERRNE